MGVMFDYYRSTVSQRAAQERLAIYSEYVLYRF